MAEEKMYTISEIAQIFRVSRKTVYEWVRKGKMPVVEVQVVEKCMCLNLGYSSNWRVIKNEEGTAHTK